MAGLFGCLHSVSLRLDLTPGRQHFAVFKTNRSAAESLLADVIGTGSPVAN